ncbi:hypothetical protein ABPG74_001521 [Tetrahymena malaccensis]
MMSSIHNDTLDKSGENIQLLAYKQYDNLDQSVFVPSQIVHAADCQTSIIDVNAGNIKYIENQKILQIQILPRCNQDKKEGLLFKDEPDCQNPQLKSGENIKQSVQKFNDKVDQNFFADPNQIVRAVNSQINIMDNAHNVKDIENQKVESSCIKDEKEGFKNKEDQQKMKIEMQQILEEKQKLDKDQQDQQEKTQKNVDKNKIGQDQSRQSSKIIKDVYLDQKKQVMLKKGGEEEEEEEDDDDDDDEGGEEEEEFIPNQDQFLRGSLTLGNNEKVNIELESCSLMIYDYSLRDQYTLDVNFLSAGHTIPQSVDSNQNINLIYTIPYYGHSDFKQSNDNGVKTLYFKNEFDSYECEIVMFIYKETQLQSLDINCGDTKQCNLIVYSNQLSITTMNVKGLNVQMNAPYLKADVNKIKHNINLQVNKLFQIFTYMSMKGSIEVPFFVFKTAYINTREGDISVQSTSDIQLAYNQTDPYNCLSSKQITNSANTFLNLQDYQNSIQFQTDLTKCEASKKKLNYLFLKILFLFNQVYPWGLDKSAQSPDKVIEYRCYSNKVILKNTGQSQSTLNASNSYGNIYVNVISGQGQYSQTFSSDNVILFNKAGKNDNQDNNKNIDYINFSNLSQSNLQNQTKSAQNPNIYDPIFVYQIGPKFTRSATFQQVQFSYNPAYSYIKPYWLGWLTLTLMTTQKYTGQYTISPGFCPYVPSLSLERIRSTQQMITNFMQQNQAPQHGLATNACDEQWIGINSDQSKNYTVTNYHISKNCYLSSAIYVSCILSGFVGIILVAILAFAINKQYIWILNHMENLRKYSSFQKEKKIEEDKPLEDLDKNPENESQVFTPSFSLSSIKILFKKVIFSLPPLIAFIDYIIHLLYKAKLNSIEEFYRLLFKKEKSNEKEEDIHNLEKYQILGSQMKQLYEKFCYLNQYLERKLDDKQNLKYLTKRGFKIVSKIGAQTQYFTYIKYNQKMVTIMSVQSNKTSLDLFISSCCSITNFQTDCIESSELESYYQEFCNLNHMQQIQLNEGSLKRDYGISTVYMPEQWVERNYSIKNPNYVIDKQKVEDHFKIFLDKDRSQQNHKYNTEENTEDITEKEKKLLEKFGNFLDHKKKSIYELLHESLIILFHCLVMILIGCPLIFLVIFIRYEQSSYSLIPPMRLIFLNTLLYYPESIPVKLIYESSYVQIIFSITLSFFYFCIYDMIIYYANIDFPQEKYFTEYSKVNLKLFTRIMWCVAFFIFYTFVVYFCMVAIWLMLGAIINPNAFLPYATSAATFVTLNKTFSQFQDLLKKMDIQDRIVDMVPTDTIKDITIEASKLGIIDASISEDIQNNLEIMIKDPASVSKLGQEIIKISQDPLAYTQNISLKLEEKAKAMIQQQISFVDKELRDDLFNLIWCLIKNQKAELKNSIRLFVNALINLFQKKKGKELVKRIQFINLNGPVFDFVWEFAFPQENFKGNYQDHLINLFCIALANMITVWNKELKPIISVDCNYQNQKSDTNKYGDNRNKKKQITEQQQQQQQQLKEKLSENANQLIKVRIGQEEEQEIELISEEAITYAYKNIIFSVIQICRSIQSSNNEVILNQILNLVENGSKLPGFYKLNQIKQYQDIFKIGYAIFKNNGEVDFEDVDLAIKGFLKNTCLEDKVKEKARVGILDVFEIVEIIIQSFKGESKLTSTDDIKKAIEKLLDSYNLALQTKVNLEILNIQYQKNDLNKANTDIEDLEQQKIRANKDQKQIKEEQEKIFKNLQSQYKTLIQINQEKSYDISQEKIIENLETILKKTESKYEKQQEEQEIYFSETQKSFEEKFVENLKNKDNIDKITEEIREKEGQKENCKNEIKDKEEKINHLENGIKQQQQQLKIPSECLINYFQKTKIKQLENGKEQNNNKLEDCESDIKDVQKIIEQLSIEDQEEEEITKNKNKIIQLENEIKNINQQITNFDTELKSKEDQLNIYKQEKNKLLIEISKIMENIQNKKEEIKQTDMDYNKLKEIKNQMKEFEACQIEWSITCQKEIQYQQQIYDLQKKKTEIKKNIENLEQKYPKISKEQEEKMNQEEEKIKAKQNEKNFKYQSTGLTIMLKFFSGSISNLKADLIKELGSFFELVSEKSVEDNEVKKMFNFLKSQILDNQSDTIGRSNSKGKDKANNFQSILNLLDIFLNDSIIASDKIIKKGKDYLLEIEVVKSLQILFTSRFEGFIKQKDIDDYFKSSDLLELISKFLKMKEDTILGFMEILLGYKTSRDAHTFWNFATQLNKIKENKINILMQLYNLYSSKNPSELYDALTFFQVTKGLTGEYKSITVKDLVSVLLFMRDSLKYKHVQTIFEKMKLFDSNDSNKKDQNSNEKENTSGKTKQEYQKTHSIIDPKTQIIDQGPITQQQIKEQIKSDKNLPKPLKKLLGIETTGYLLTKTIKADFDAINQNKQAKLQQADFNFFKKFLSIRNIPRIQDPTQNSLVKQSIADIADMLNLDYQSIQIFINLLTSSKSENIKQSLDTLQILKINPKCDNDNIKKFVEYSTSILEKIEKKDQILANISKNIFQDKLPSCLLRKILYHEEAKINYSEYLELFNIYCNNDIPKSIKNLIEFRFGISGSDEQEDIYSFLQPSLEPQKNTFKKKKDEYIKKNEGLIKAVQILSINDEAVRIQHFLQFLIKNKQEALLIASCLIIYFSGRSSNITLKIEIKNKNKNKWNVEETLSEYLDISPEFFEAIHTYFQQDSHYCTKTMIKFYRKLDYIEEQNSDIKKSIALKNKLTISEKNVEQYVRLVNHMQFNTSYISKDTKIPIEVVELVSNMMHIKYSKSQQERNVIYESMRSNIYISKLFQQLGVNHQELIALIKLMYQDYETSNIKWISKSLKLPLQFKIDGLQQLAMIDQILPIYGESSQNKNLLSCRYSSFQTTEFLYQLYTIISQKQVKNEHIAIEKRLKKGNTLQYAIYEFTKSTQMSPVWTLLMMGDYNAWEYIAQSYYLVKESKKPYLNPILALVYVLNFRSKPLIIKKLLADLEYARRCLQIYSAQSKKKNEQNKQAEGNLTEKKQQDTQNINKEQNDQIGESIYKTLNPQQLEDKIKYLKEQINQILKDNLVKDGEKQIILNNIYEFLQKLKFKRLIQIAEEFNFPKKVIEMLMLYEQDQQEQNQNKKGHEEEKKDIRLTTDQVQKAFRALYDVKQINFLNFTNLNCYKKRGNPSELKILNKVFKCFGSDFYKDPRIEKIDPKEEKNNFTKIYCIYKHSSSSIMQMVVLSTISQLKLSYYDFYGFNKHDENHYKLVTFAIDLILGTLEKYYYFDDMMDFFPRHRLIQLIGLSVGFIIELNDVISCKTSSNIFGKNYYKNVILKICEEVYQGQENNNKDIYKLDKQQIEQRDQSKQDHKLKYLKQIVDSYLQPIFEENSMQQEKQEFNQKNIETLIDNYDNMIWDSIEKDELLNHINDSKCSYKDTGSLDEIDHYSGETKKDLFKYLQNLSKVTETENFKYLIDLYKENYIFLNENDYFKANYGQDSNMYFGTLILNGIIQQQQIKQIKFENFQSCVNQASLYMVSNKKALAEILSFLIPSLESNFTSLNELLDISGENLQNFINLAMGKSQYQSNDLERLLKKSSLLDSNKETLKNCVSAYQGDMRQYLKLIKQSKYFKKSPKALDLFTKFLWSFEKTSMHNTTNNPHEINYFEFCAFNIIFNTKPDQKCMEKLQILALVKSGLNVSADKLNNFLNSENIKKMIVTGKNDLFSDKPKEIYLQLLLSLSNNSIVHILNSLNIEQASNNKDQEKPQNNNLPYILQSLFLWKNISNIKWDNIFQNSQKVLKDKTKTDQQQQGQFKRQIDFLFNYIQYLSILPAAILDNSNKKDQKPNENYNQGTNKQTLLEIAFENHDLQEFFFRSHKNGESSNQAGIMINTITDILQSILDKPILSINNSDLIKEVLKLLKYASKGNIDVSIIEDVISIINGDHQSIFSILKKFDVVEENKIVLIQRAYSQIIDMPIFKKIDKPIVGTNSNEEANTFKEIIKKLQDGKATINDLFVALDAHGDNNGRISIDEFQSLFRRLGMELSRNRVFEIFAYVKNAKQKPVGAIKTDDLDLDEEEFEKAFKYVNDKKTSMSLEKLGISPALLALQLGFLVVILIGLFIFIFLGINAFTVGGTFGSIINSIIPIISALGFTRTQENIKDKLKEEEISNAIDKTLTIIHSENI